MTIYLLETNVSCKGTEAPPAHHQTVFPDDTTAISTGTAEFYMSKIVPYACISG